MASCASPTEGSAVSYKPVNLEGDTIKTWLPEPIRHLSAVVYGRRTSQLTLGATGGASAGRVVSSNSVFFQKGRPDDALYKRHRELQTHFPRSLTYIVEEGAGSDATKGRVMAVLHGPHKFTGEEDDEKETSLFSAAGYEGATPARVHVTAKMNGKFAMLGYIEHEGFEGGGAYVVGSKDSKTLIPAAAWDACKVENSGLAKEIAEAFFRFWHDIPEAGQTRLRNLLRVHKEDGARVAYTLLCEYNDGKHMVPLAVGEDAYVTVVAVEKCHQTDLGASGPVQQVEGRFVYQWLEEDVGIPRKYIVEWMEMTHEKYLRERDGLHTSNLFDESFPFCEGYVVYHWAEDGHWLALEKRKHWTYVLLRLIREWIQGSRSDALRARMENRNKSYMQMDPAVIDRWATIAEFFVEYIDRATEGDPAAAVNFGATNRGMGNTWADFEKVSGVRHTACYVGEEEFEEMMAGVRVPEDRLQFEHVVYVVDLEAPAETLQEVAAELSQQGARSVAQIGRKTKGLGDCHVIVVSRPQKKKGGISVFLERDEATYESRLPNKGQRNSLLRHTKENCQFAAAGMDAMLEAVKRAGNAKIVKRNCGEHKFLVVPMHTVIGVGKSVVLRALAQRMKWAYISKDEIERFSGEDMGGEGSADDDGNSKREPLKGPELAKATEKCVMAGWARKRVVVLDRNFSPAWQYHTLRKLVRKLRTQVLCVDFGLRASSVVDAEGSLPPCSVEDLEASAMAAAVAVAESEEVASAAAAAAAAAETTDIDLAEKRKSGEPEVPEGLGMGSLAERLVFFKRRVADLDKHDSIRTTQALCSSSQFFLTKKFLAFGPRESAFPAVASVQLWNSAPTVTAGRDQVRAWFRAVESGDQETSFRLAELITVEYEATPVEEIVDSLEHQLLAVKGDGEAPEAPEDAVELQDWFNRSMRSLLFRYVQNEYVVRDPASVEALAALVPEGKEARPHVTILHANVPTAEQQQAFCALPEQLEFRALEVCSVDGLACVMVELVEDSLTPAVVTLKGNGPLHVTMLCVRTMGHAMVDSNYIQTREDVVRVPVEREIIFIGERLSRSGS